MPTDVVVAFSYKIARERLELQEAIIVVGGPVVLGLATVAACIMNESLAQAFVLLGQT